MTPEIRVIAVDALIPYARNARTHSDGQVAQIAASIAEFGFTNPILSDGKRGVIAGHGRLMAARKLGLTKGPVMELAHLTPIQKKAYILADNRIAENAGWAEELLKLELAELQAAEYDLDLMGFSDEEIDKLLNGDEQSDGLTDEDAVPETPVEPTSKPGDLWILGNHRLLCGDSTVLTDVERLMDGQLADMAFTDLPYNVDYGNSAKDKMRGKDRRILNEGLGDGFYQFLYDACVNLLVVTKGGCYVRMSSSELHTLQKAWLDAGGKWSTFVIWAKNTFTLGRADYQRQYEPILYGWKQGADHFRCGDQDQADVWFYNNPRVNDLHPTIKLVELVERAIRNSSKSRDVVLELFGGSDTLHTQRTINQEISNEFQTKKGLLAGLRPALRSGVVGLRVQPIQDAGTLPIVSATAAGIAAASTDALPDSAGLATGISSEQLARDAAETTFMVLELQQWHTRQSAAGGTPVP